MVDLPIIKPVTLGFFKRNFGFYEKDTQDKINIALTGQWYGSCVSYKKVGMIIA